MTKRDRTGARIRRKQLDERGLPVDALDLEVDGAIPPEKAPSPISVKDIPDPDRERDAHD